MADCTQADKQQPPLPSHIVTHPELARTFEAVAKHGKEGFYKGRIAEGVSRGLQSCTGHLAPSSSAAPSVQIPSWAAFRAAVVNP
jgi:gamma-glutamyltranspeptidase/glutathione hydrolase